MKNEFKGKKLEALVFRVFLKHVKANNLYIAFRWAVNRDNAHKDIIHALSSSLCRQSYRHSSDRISRLGCAFVSAHSIDDIIRFMQAEGGKSCNDDDRKLQMTIMNMVNMLIHSCIEHALTNDMPRLEKIGSAVFEEVGKKIFGDDFKDMTEEVIDPRHHELFEKIKEMGDSLGALPPNEYVEFVKTIQKSIGEIKMRPMMHEVDRRYEIKRKDEIEEDTPFIPLSNFIDYDDEWI